MPGVRIQKDLLSGRLKKKVVFAFLHLDIEALNCLYVQKLSPSSWASSFGPYRGIVNDHAACKAASVGQTCPTRRNRLLHVVWVVFVTQCETRSHAMVRSLLASIKLACAIICVYGISDHPSFSGSEQHPRPWDFEC